MFQTSLKNYLVLGAVLVTGILLGYILGVGAKSQVYQMGFLEGKTVTEQEYQEKIEKIFPPAPEPEKVYSVTGKITKIDGQTLTLKVTLPVSNPLEEPKTETKTVEITDATTVVKQLPKSPEEFMAEEEAFAAGEREALPSLYDEEAIDSSELKIGNTITAESEENIKGKIGFEAKKIILISEGL